MHYLKQNYGDALRFIQEAEFLMMRNGFKDQGNVYGLYGLILIEQGENLRGEALGQKLSELLP